MTPNDFLKIIEEEINAVDQVPEGWYSTSDLEKKWKLSSVCVQRRIKIGKQLGYVSERKFAVKKNLVRRIPHYKFHEKENSQKDNKRKNMEDSIRLRRKD